ncbi:hypothetical protein [Stappia stellulata]|uniref:hypothetical protein n=1 Tax=Stappia stellulata TaxID=71235 RepID=UPI000414F50D|nr:hypothetical protein [Stappia stellulata]
MTSQIPFRAKLDDFLLSLARGDLLEAIGAHYAPDARLFENDILVARDRATVLRKLQPVLRRFAMVRGTFDELTCERDTGRVRFFCRIDGVDIDGRIVREEVFHAQVWAGGAVVEERQYRGDALARLFSRSFAPSRRGPLPASRVSAPLPTPGAAVMAVRTLGA